MRKLLAAGAAFLLAIAGANASSHVIFRVHLAANANDGEVFAQPVRSLGGRDFFVEKTPWLSEHDVKSFYPYGAADGSYGALIQLDDHGRLILDTLSIERRGASMFIFVDGRLLTEMQIDRRVSDGKIYLPSGLNAADLKLMTKDWKMTGRQKSDPHAPASKRPPLPNE
jgi:hypothetical protein